MNQSDDIVNLAEAILAAQGEMGGAVKSSSNPFFKSSYADLNSVLLALKPIYQKHGLAVIQLPHSDENGVGVVTQVMHTSGQWLRHEFTLPLVKNDPQQAGSAITYARRYALKALGLMPDLDDDAEGAMFRTAKAYNDDERREFYDLINAGDGWGLKRFALHHGVDVLDELFNSAEKGKKTEFKNLYRAAVNDANTAMQNLVSEIHVSADDGEWDAIREALEELEGDEEFFVKRAIEADVLLARKLEAGGIEL